MIFCKYDKLFSFALNVKSDGIISSFLSNRIEATSEKNDNKTAVITLSSIVDQEQKALNESLSFNLYAITQINPSPNTIN
jgi:hypothetical protein